MTAREVLEIATRGGAAVLGRDDIGSLEVGKCADFFSIDLNTVDYAGALHDPVAATVFCAPQKARYTVINGRVVVENGQVVTVNMRPVIDAHNRFAQPVRRSIVSLPVDSAAACVALESATIVIARRVLPERERDYLAWQAKIGERCAALGPIVSPHASGAG